MSGGDLFDLILFGLVVHWSVSLSCDASVVRLSSNRVATVGKY